MKKLVIASIISLAPAAALAQSAVDAMTLSQNDIRGTARFMAMGGAFTALGGDMSTLTQNPAGIGVYRRSEISATLDISPSSIKAVTPAESRKTSWTPIACNNFGYIGTVNLNGAMQTFSWGASYNRLASFSRKYSVYNNPINTSLSNYVASYSGGYSPQELEFNGNYDPYADSSADWLSILSYNSYLINPTQTGYRGLWNNTTTGDSYAEVNESGYVDEYNIDFGGNVSDMVMWGIGFGITDLQYNRSAYYDEHLDNASVVSSTGSLRNGYAEYSLGNSRNINGTGFNLKLGLIFKPINEIRIGVAFHSPTWYTLSNNAVGDVDYYFASTNANGGVDEISGYEYTDNGYYNFRLNTPWKFMVGAAGVIGSSAIISADYEYQAYNKMTMSEQGYYGQYIGNDVVNNDIQNYYKAANIFRVGLEYRVTPSFSVRAGYNYTSSACSEYTLNGGEIVTAGTDPAFTIGHDSNAVSLGLGYRYKIFFIDAAYVYRNKKSTYKAFTDYNNVFAPQASLTQATNSVVFTLGFKF